MNFVRIGDILRSKNSRNTMLRNNILLSAIMKVTGLATSFLIVPITLDFLDNEQYGVWMTLTSILLWFAFFDVGLGNGMRNYLAQAIAQEDYAKGRTYLTTTLVMLTAIAMVLAILSVTFIMAADLKAVFNTTHLTTKQLRLPVLVAIVMTLINFVTKNIGVVYIALQKYAVNDLITISASVVGLIAVFVLTKTIPPGNLTAIVLVFTVLPVIAFLTAGIPLFRRYPQLRPSRGDFDWHIGKQLLGKGMGFFFIQITSCLIIFGGSNLFITQFAGPEAVTTYNIAYKYFNQLAIAYTIVVSPMWNAYTEAAVKGDYVWIKSNFRRSLAIWALMLSGGLFMLLVAHLFFQFWVGNAVTVPFSVSLSVLCYITFFNLNNCVTMLINGLNKISVQIVTSVIATAAFLVAVMILGPKLGIEGVVGCMAASYAAMAAVHLYQCHLLIHQKATGIWNR